MNITLWIITGLLALAFLATGTMKLAQSKSKLAASGQSWVEDFSGSTVKTIGSLEIAGALGLVLPAVLDTVTFLVPLAATGLFLLMIGAAITHSRHHETPNIIINIVLAILAAGLAFARLGPYSL